MKNTLFKKLNHQSTIIHYVVANNEEHAIQKAKSLDCQADTREQYGSNFKAELNPVLYREEKE